MRKNYNIKKINCLKKVRKLRLENIHKEKSMKMKMNKTNSHNKMKITNNNKIMSKTNNKVKMNKIN